MYERLFLVGTATATTVQYGYFVDDNQQSYYGEPLIFYGYRVTGGTSICLKEGVGNNHSINGYTLKYY